MGLLALTLLKHLNSLPSSSILPLNSLGSWGWLDSLPDSLKVELDVVLGYT